jgi:hypothetical protein
VNTKWEGKEGIREWIELKLNPVKRVLGQSKVDMGSCDLRPRRVLQRTSEGGQVSRLGLVSHALGQIDAVMMREEGRRVRKSFWYFGLSLTKLR